MDILKMSKIDFLKIEFQKIIKKNNKNNNKQYLLLFTNFL